MRSGSKDLVSDDTLRVTGIVTADARGVPTNKTDRYITPFSMDFGVIVEF